MTKYIGWDMECPECGFAFYVGFPADSSVEDKGLGKKRSDTE